MRGEGIRKAIYGERDELAFATACGPISLLAVCELLGVPVTLEQAIKDCNWSIGNPPTLSTVVSALEHRTGCEYKIVEVPRGSRESFLARIPPGSMLMLRPLAGELQHLAVVLESADSGEICVFDFPKGVVRTPRDSLDSRWDGIAVVRSDSLGNPRFIWTGMACVCVGAGWMYRIWRRRNEA